MYSNEPYTVEYDEEKEEYVVEGPRIEKMLGYTNIESEKGFLFFQRFLKEQGILGELEKLGIQEGDTAVSYTHLCRCQNKVRGKTCRCAVGN